MIQIQYYHVLVIIVFGTFFGHFENLPLLSEIKPPPKIQQTKMLVTYQRFGDWFSFGLVWPYSSDQKNIMKVGSKSLRLTCSSNKL